MSRKTQFAGTSLVLFALAGSQWGCQNLPGSSRSQGAVIGGIAGGVVGAAIAKNNRLLGALIGAALGAGGGYLIGTAVEHADGKEDDKKAAAEAARKAAENPARAKDVAGARSADLNSDGFVTMDEVIAMKEANLTDAEMVDRLRASGQVFELTEEQEQYLVDQGISRSVITEMEKMNQVKKEEILAKRAQVLGRPAP